LLKALGAKAQFSFKSYVAAEAATHKACDHRDSGIRENFWISRRAKIFVGHAFSRDIKGVDKDRL
jgi:hypothetical protein